MPFEKLVEMAKTELSTGEGKEQIDLPKDALAESKGDLPKDVLAVPEDISLPQDIFANPSSEKPGQKKLDANDGGSNAKTDNKKENQIEAETKRMEPPIDVEPFKCPESLDSKEYKRQVDGQNKGLNNLSIQEYLDNRKAFEDRKEEVGNGRDVSNAGPAQQRVREEARADRVAENREKGMNRNDAEAEADEWMKTQAALHDPDQIAGGKAENVTGMGDSRVNSSIGKQWASRVDKIDAAVNDYIEKNNLTKEDCENTKMNVKLSVEVEQ